MPKRTIPELVGPYEAAQILQAGVGNLDNKKWPRLPEPVAHLRSGRVWVKADIEALAAEHPPERRGPANIVAARRRDNGGE